VSSQQQEVKKAALMFDQQGLRSEDYCHLCGLKESKVPLLLSTFLHSVQTLTAHGEYH